LFIPYFTIGARNAKPFCKQKVEAVAPNEAKMPQNARMAGSGKLHRSVTKSDERRL
jgi:hypothetical protein